MQDVIAAVQQLPDRGQVLLLMYFVYLYEQAYQRGVVDGATGAAKMSDQQMNADIYDLLLFTGEQIEAAVDETRRGPFKPEDYWRF